MEERDPIIYLNGEITNQNDFTPTGIMPNFAEEFTKEEFEGSNQGATNFMLK
ncbi:MAG TPA: hypothetical protein VK517_08285 [Cyclobacteriaceae bacterium]|nr:hypothetical protein [Cyclobacteriaceae bacterium]